MIQACFISNSADPKAHSDYTLINNVCRTDDSVEFYPQEVELPVSHGDTGRRRFRFTYRSKVNASLLYLHCQMSPCSKSPLDRRGLPEVSAHPWNPLSGERPVS